MANTDDTPLHGDALELMDRLAEMGETHFEARRLNQAQYFMMRSLFVGVRQLVIMTGEAKALSAEDRARHADAHLTTVKLLSETLNVLGAHDDDDDEDAIPNA